MASSTAIRSRYFILASAVEIARFSFIVRNSISYLDLELRQLSESTNSHWPPWNSGRLEGSGNFINTDEKCRQFFCPSRRILYTLHLDLPKEREPDLKDISKFAVKFDFSNSPTISKIEIDCGFDESILNNFVDYALNNNFPKLKILKWILEIPSLCLMNSRTANKFIDCFYPEVTDSALFKDFVLQFDIVEFMTEHQKPDILAHLLYHARLYGRKDITDYHGYSIEEIGRCVYHQLYLNIGAILKSIDTLRFAYYDYELFLDVITSARPSLTMKGFLKSEAVKLLEQGRLNHICAIICMYIDNNPDGCTESVSEALRLIWSSVPDACITYKEMKALFGVAFSDRELEDMHTFYVTAIGEFHERVEPRSLKHQCRTVLRKTLRKNEVWIPEGVGRMGLPKSLQSFLNLEKAQKFSVC